MKFENALVAMRKGYTVQRQKNKDRLNGVCLFIKDGVMYAKRTHQLSNHTIVDVYHLPSSSIMAEDWEAFK